MSSQSHKMPIFLLVHFSIGKVTAFFSREIPISMLGSRLAALAMQTIESFCICVFMYLCIYVFVYLCICLFVYLCICTNSGATA